jgi:hypothetical protein
MQYSKNTSILKYGLIAVLLCLIISIFFYMQFFLDKPVFLKHYYDLVIREDMRMNLHFITNSSDNIRINKIEFPQLPNDFAHIELDYFTNISENGYFRSQTHTHYNYNELCLLIHVLGENENENEESVILDKAVVHYSGGDSQEVDIGKIILHKNVKQTNMLTSEFTKSSNDNTSAEGFAPADNIIDDIFIESIKSDLNDELEGIFELKLNGADVRDLSYPIDISAGEILRFESRFKFEPEDDRIYNVYDIHGRISVADSQGNKGIMRILNLYYNPSEVFISEKGIIQYLKEIGVR